MRETLLDVEFRLSACHRLLSAYHVQLYSLAIVQVNNLINVMARVLGGSWCFLFSLSLYLPLHLFFSFSLFLDILG